MKLEKIDLFGCDYDGDPIPVAYQDENGIWKYCEKRMVEKFKAKKSIFINVDAISSVLKTKVETGDLEYKRNPLCRWYTIGEPLNYTVLTNLKTVEIVKIRMLNGKTYCIDAKKIPSWLYSQMKKN